MGSSAQRIERWLSQCALLRLRWSATCSRRLRLVSATGSTIAHAIWTSARVQAGAAFVRNHQSAMERAQREFGVPPEIIAAIIGVETNYGRITGNFRTLDALVTLSFDYLRRAEYYRQQLTEFFLLVREQKSDPLTIKGSFAGALGLPQFMPGSIRRHAVDFDGDGRVDLSEQRRRCDRLGRQFSCRPRLAARYCRSCSMRWPTKLRSTHSGAASTPRSPGRMRSRRASKATCRLPLDAQVLVIDLPVVNGGEVERLYRVGTVNFSALSALQPQLLLRKRSRGAVACDRVADSSPR